MSGFAWCAERHALGIESMDETHRAFLEHARNVSGCAGADFAAAFDALLAHTAEHFAAEDALLRASRCPSAAEHLGEHARVLADLARMQGGIRRGRPALARAFVAERLAECFETHLASMDAALAMHLRSR